MNRERWQRVESLFLAALEQPSARRAAFLDESCGPDGALKSEVRALLTQHESDPHFLGTPVLTRRDADAAPEEATRVGPYRIVREIGAGGMGVVYLAVHEGPDFERPVALKVVRRGMDTDDMLRRFQAERRILAGLKHPNVARFIDAGVTDDGRPYFVMDFVEGVPIDAYGERHGLSVPQRLRLFQTVCAAVEYAHANLIVHRDLKPGNILVGTDGVPVLLDFGIAKLLDAPVSDVATTRTGVRAFTPEYASPEQVRGEPVSTATDVYGLGLLLYRLLTGRRAFEARTASELETAVLERDPHRPSVVGGRHLAGDLDNIVLKALRREPERRYPSVAALAEDVRRHLDGRPVRARPDTFAYRAGKFVRRNRVAVAAALVVFVSLIGATAYSTAQARAVRRERDKALEVQRFLLEMFGASGRDRADTVSVRQLLDGQAAVVPIAYADNPELHAEMLSVIAEGYDRLGLFAQAEPLARRALEIRRGTLAPDHPDLIGSVSLLGWILHERGNSKEGEALLREALALWPGARPANPVGYARTLNDLGVNREAAGEYDEAGDLYRRALAMRRQQYGNADRSVAVTGSNLAVVLYRKGDRPGAIAVAETALAVMRRAAGPDHQRSTLIQGNLAAMRSGAGDLTGAEAEYWDVVGRQTRVLGRQHPVTAGTLMGLASVIRAQRRLGEADTLFTEALASFEKAYGPDHPRVATALAALGGVRATQGRTRDAIPLLERALAIQRKARGEEHRDVKALRARLDSLRSSANRSR